MNQLPAVETPSRRFYRPELDALRFFAFFFVFLNHAMLYLHSGTFFGLKAHIAFFENGLKDEMAYGVCLFFFLSAYLITELLFEERSSTGTVHVQAFYIRRILRIWPLYFAFILGGALLGTVLPSARMEAGRLFAFLLLMGNWYVVWHGFPAVGAYTPLWSISIEEQLYLILPAVIRSGGRRLMLAVCCMILPVSWSILWWVTSHGGSKDQIWTNSFVQFQFFAFGGLAALIIGRRRPGFNLPLRMALFLAGPVLWWFSQARRPIGDSAPGMVFGYLLIAAGCLCIFLAFLGISNRLLPRWMLYLGKISYGLYIFHRLALSLTERLRLFLFNTPNSNYVRWWQIVLSDAVGLALTILLASFSYRYLETPFLRLKERFAFIRTRAV